MRLLLSALVASLLFGAVAPAATRDGGLLAALARFRIALGEAPLRVVPFVSVEGDTWGFRAKDTADPAAAIAGWPEFLAVALDPRARTVGAFVRPGGSVSVAVGVDAAAPFSAPVLPRRFDPGSPLGLTVIAPGPIGPVRLVEWRAGTVVELRTTVARARGVGGAQVALIDAPGHDGLRLAYGLRYRLMFGGSAFTFTTAPLPAAYRARSWRFTASMGPRSRAAFLRAVALSPPLLRRIIAELDGDVAVSRRSCGGEGDSCTDVAKDGSYSIWMSPADLDDPPSARFVVVHEIAHVVDDVGLDATAHAAFRALFKRSPAWRSCFPDQPRGCVPFEEILADQFAFWVTGFTEDPAGGYGDPPLAGRAAFERVLAQQYAFRPPYWRNPAAG